MERPVIMCVDDERGILETLSAQLFSHLGDKYEYETADSGSEALEVAESIIDSGQLLAVIVSDQLMPQMTGDELLVKLHSFAPQTNKILLTGQATADAVGRALNQANLYRYIAKPWDTTDLMMTVEEAAKSFLQLRQIDQQNSILESLYFASNILGRENSPEGLIQKLMEIVLDHTKADRVALIRCKNEFIQAPIVYKVSEELVKIGKIPPIIPDDDLAIGMSIIRQAIEFRRLILVSNCNVHPWGNDTYIQERKPKSAFAIPMILDDRLEGIFYFEHFNKYSAFGREAVEFMQLFTSQAAISLDNAELYAGLEQKVRERTQEISLQKEIIEEKNKDIQDSMLYASRLQDAMLSNAEGFNQFFADASIFLRPKDMVSGDFYWYDVQGEVIYFAAVDCTGHGVPGGLLSILGANLLSTIVSKGELPTPSSVLTRLHKKLLAKLRQKSGNQPLDGMDIALCRYDRKNNELLFAGANRPLFHLRNEELNEIKSEKMSIGGHTPLDYVFQDAKVEVQKGDSIFIFSDGYTDQFGGEQHKKLTARSLRDSIIANGQLPINKLFEMLVDQFIAWKGDTEQTDDVLLIGVRF